MTVFITALLVAYATGVVAALTYVVGTLLNSEEWPGFLAAGISLALAFAWPLVWVVLRLECPCRREVRA